MLRIVRKRLGSRSKGSVWFSNYKFTRNLGVKFNEDIDDERARPNDGGVLHDEIFCLLRRVVAGRMEQEKKFSTRNDKLSRFSIKKQSRSVVKACFAFHSSSLRRKVAMAGPPIYLSLATTSALVNKTLCSES